MKIVGNISDVALSLSGEALITVATKDKAAVLSCIDDLKDKDLSIELKPYFKKRSKNANNYMWELLGQLSAKLRIPPEEIYRECIRDVGDNYTVVCVQTKDKDKVKRGWESSGIGWLAEELDSQINGCTNLRLFVGSSMYNTAQMSRLVDIVVQECKEQGIQTETPEEIERMLSLMEGK